MHKKTWYYKTTHESTGSVKYIKTSSEGCTVVVLWGGQPPRMETSQNPYPMDSCEAFESIPDRDFFAAKQMFLNSKKAVFTTN